MNPYEPAPTLTTVRTAIPGVHPDLKWMLAMIYVFCTMCMLGIPGKTNPPNSSVVGFGHGFIPGPASLGAVGFYFAIPILAAIPVVVLGAALRPLYRFDSERTDMTAHNVLFLLCGLVLGVVNASLYRGD